MKTAQTPTLSQQQLAELKIAEQNELLSTADDFWIPRTAKELIIYARENFDNPEVFTFFLKNVKLGAQ